MSNSVTALENDGPANLGGKVAEAPDAVNQQDSDKAGPSRAAGVNLLAHEVARPSPLASPIVEDTPPPSSSQIVSENQHGLPRSSGLADLHTHATGIPHGPTPLSQDPASAFRQLGDAVLSVEDMQTAWVTFKSFVGNFCNPVNEPKVVSAVHQATRLTEYIRMPLDDRILAGDLVLKSEVVLSNEGGIFRRQSPFWIRFLGVKPLAKKYSFQLVPRTHPDKASGLSRHEFTTPVPLSSIIVLIDMISSHYSRGAPGAGPSRAPDSSMWEWLVEWLTRNGPVPGGNSGGAVGSGATTIAGGPGRTESLTGGQLTSTGRRLNDTDLEDYLNTDFVDHWRLLNYDAYITQLKRWGTLPEATEAYMSKLYQALAERAERTGEIMGPVEGTRLAAMEQANKEQGW